MRIEFSDLVLYEQGGQVNFPNAIGRVPIESLEAEIRFYNAAGDMIFSEVDFDIVILLRQLQSWLQERPLPNFTFRGDEIGWLLDLHFEVLAETISFVVKNEDREHIRVKFASEEFLSGIKAFCTSLTAKIKSTYGISL